MVVGGVGDYLDVADQVILMNHWEAMDCTPQASSWPNLGRAGQSYGNRWSENSAKQFKATGERSDSGTR